LGYSQIKIINICLLNVSYSNLIVFGDSIVDTGNTQAAVLLATIGTIDFTPASAGYFEGRFTNGLNPADVVNQAIKGTNLTGSLFGVDNYSFGGARALTDKDEIPDITSQFGSYLVDVGVLADASSLYLINVGGNDIRDILVDMLDPTATILAAATAIGTLQAAGASEFLFVGVGNVGGIPEFQTFPGGPAAGRFLSESLNTAIEAALTPLNVDFYDSIGFLTAFCRC
jgi:phospholipase/lecithinase/hemolysin